MGGVVPKRTRLVATLIFALCSFEYVAADAETDAKETMKKFDVCIKSVSAFKSVFAQFHTSSILNELKSIYKTAAESPKPNFDEVFQLTRRHNKACATQKDALEKIIAFFTGCLTFVKNVSAREDRMMRKDAAKQKAVDEAAAKKQNVAETTKNISHHVARPPTYQRHYSITSNLHPPIPSKIRRVSTIKSNASLKPNLPIRSTP